MRTGKKACEQAAAGDQPGGGGTGANQSGTASMGTGR